MCTISVIGLGIIGTFKGKEAIPYIYIVQVSNANTLFTFLEKANIGPKTIFDINHHD